MVLVHTLRIRSIDCQHKTKQLKSHSYTLSLTIIFKSQVNKYILFCIMNIIRVYNNV